MACDFMFHKLSSLNLTNPQAFTPCVGWRWATKENETGPVSADGRTLASTIESTGGASGGNSNQGQPQKKSYIHLLAVLYCNGSVVRPYFSYLLGEGFSYTIFSN